jgi:VanZ family protein
VWGVWLAVGAYVAVIFALSSIPDLTPPGKVTYSDKIAHFVEYGGLGFLLFRALERAGLRAPLLVLAVVVVGMVVGGLDELYQGTVGREQSVSDWLADVAGLVAVSLAMAGYRRGASHARS